MELHISEILKKSWMKLFKNTVKPFKNEEDDARVVNLIVIGLTGLRVDPSSSYSDRQSDF